jgi:beta-mannosidase
MPSDDSQPLGLTPPRVSVEGHFEVSLGEGWEAAAAAPGSRTDPSQLDGLDWIAASVPGTVAAALRDAGRWRVGESSDLDAEDWWFRTQFEAPPAARGEEVVLRLDGVATLAEVFLNGAPLLQSETMFCANAVEVGSLLSEDGNELAIRCRALGPELRVRRRPRARWRTKLVDGGLRFFRTMLLGRAPGFAPGPAAVGPWRPVWIERRRLLAVDRLELATKLEGADGVLSVRASLRGLGEAVPGEVEVELGGASGVHRAPLQSEATPGGVEVSGTLTVPDVERWWPHTHGDPVLHEVALHVAIDSETVAIEVGRVGFRNLTAGPEPDHDAEADGLDFHVNGIRVFVRGAVWTPADAVSLAPSEATLDAALAQVRDAGMNMLRIPGTGAYENCRFHDLCDELGILVWQDFMFANLDYPIADEDFRATVEREAREQLGRLAGRPSLAVVCGNSEVEQQVAMLGLDPELGRGELFGELLPRLVKEAGIDATYLPSAPCGGERPFRPDRGVANYYGVGGYRRPLEDARRAEVRFAAECLALANVPDEAGLQDILPEAPGDLVAHHPRWKAGVPRDVGSGWDFDDVRDHYLALLFDLDPGELRRYDHERYLELSRVVSGEVMAAVFGEWRRSASPCGGGLVLWMRDLAPGAGWGILDHTGEPKCAYHYLRRALSPIAVWMTDEGLGGVGVHAANDRPEALSARLRVALYRDFEQPVAEVREELEIAPHAGCSLDIESMLGRFVDASWAYRFGPPAQNLIVASIEKERDDGAPDLISQATYLPDGRPSAVENPDRLGIEADVRHGPQGSALLSLKSRRFVYGLRVHSSGLVPEDDAFSLEPGQTRLLTLEPAATEAQTGAVALTALNLRGRVMVALPD